MNSVVEYEAAAMMSLRDEDPLASRMLLEGMGVPLDAQDEILAVAAAMPESDTAELSKVIERYYGGTADNQLLR
ncbi:hypothetical protein [Ferrimonas lipolytica]|uniref:Uncharacterized protein n=1 Tax=Ferrimonas lipolytica TaxID=2724191 RepID=A0A6H1UB32_9GAMM|nr:hypothetical protein [Ferrimonas lipolytica]QIZ75849.1 hypothetical protein HER31_02500 [Ferrimonas lipolytica]